MNHKFDIKYFNAAFNPIGYDVKFHECDRCIRYDILEFFDRNTGEEINAHFVIPTDIFAWTNGSYRVKSAWEARDIVIKQNYE